MLLEKMWNTNSFQEWSKSTMLLRMGQRTLSAVHLVVIIHSNTHTASPGVTYLVSNKFLTRSATTSLNEKYSNIFSQKALKKSLNLLK
jgi:hypothetical protein